MRITSLILLLVCIGNWSFAQNLNQEWEKLKSAGTSGDYEQSVSTINAFLKRPLSDSLRAEVLFTKAALGKRSGEHRKALEDVDQVITLTKNLGFFDLECRALILKSRIYLSTAAYNQAIATLLTALQIADEHSNRPNQAAIHNYIGIAYDYQGIYNEAIAHYRVATQIYSEEGMKDGLSQSLNNIGVVYDMQSRYDSAIYYYEKSLQLDTQLGDSLGIAGSYMNIGLIRMAEGELAEAERLFVSAEEVYRKKNDIENLAACYNNLSELAHNVNDLDKMVLYNERSREIAERSGNLQQIASNYEVLITAFAELGEFEKAFRYSRKRSAIMDSIRRQSLSLEINELKAKYELDQHKMELARQEEIARSQEERLFWKDITVYGVSIAGGFLLIMGFFLYRNNKRTIRANKLLKESQQELSVKQQHIEEQNRDIRSSILYAGDIQRAILPTEEKMDRVLGEHLLLNIPKDIISGDFYWIQETHDLKLIAVADCTGHGVPGAFVSLMCTNVLNYVVAGLGITDPGEILTRTNIELKNKLKAETSSTRDGMDLVIVAISNDGVRYAGAMNYLYKTGREGLKEYRTDQYSIAGRTPDEFRFTTHELDVEKGDTIFLTTDGYQDQFGGEKGKKYMRRRLKELFVEASALHPDQMEKLFLDSFHSWKRDYDQVDDICILSFQV